jgi:hypothetical protein
MRRRRKRLLDGRADVGGRRVIRRKVGSCASPISVNHAKGCIMRCMTVIDWREVAKQKDKTDHLASRVYDAHNEDH